MTDFTREQLEDFQAVAYNHPLDGYRNTVQDLAAFALAQLDRAEKAEELTKDKDRTLAQAIKSHLREVDKRKQAETISSRNLARAEKAEAERDEARAMKVPATTEAVMLAEMGEKVARTEAWAAKEELRIAEAERDRMRAQLDSILANSDSLESGKLADANAEIARLREELLGAKVAWDMCDAVNRGLRAELREAEEAIRYVSMTDVNDCFLPNGHEMKGAYGFRGFLGDWYAYPRRMQAAVRRARERTEINKEQEDK